MLVRRWRSASRGSPTCRSTICSLASLRPPGRAPTVATHPTSPTKLRPSRIHRARAPRRKAVGAVGSKWCDRYGDRNTHVFHSVTYRHEWLLQGDRPSVTLVVPRGWEHVERAGKTPGGRSGGRRSAWHQAGRVG